MPDDIDRILALIENAATAIGQQAQIIERLDARVRQLERMDAVARGAIYRPARPSAPLTSKP